MTTTVPALKNEPTKRKYKKPPFVPLPNGEASLSRTSSRPSGLASLWVMLLGDRAQKHRLMHECVAGPSTASRNPNSQSGEQLWGSWKTREQGCFPLVVKAQRNQCCLTNSARKHISTCMSSPHPHTSHPHPCTGQEKAQTAPPRSQIPPASAQL